MQALCDIQLTKDNVRINIMKNRDLLHVFIDDMQQDSSQDLCKFLMYMYMIFHIVRYHREWFIGFLISSWIESNADIEVETKTKWICWKLPFTRRHCRWAGHQLNDIDNVVARQIETINKKYNDQKHISWSKFVTWSAIEKKN